MFITVPIPKIFSEIDLTRYVKVKAQKNLMSLPFKTTEKFIDKKCVEKFKLPLRAVCMYLIDHCTAIQDKPANQITIVFRTELANDIASFISYGDGTFHGTETLRKIFTL